MTKKTMKQIFKELENISLWFESEDIDIDVGLKKYKEGMKLIKEAESQLKKVANEIELVAGE